MKSQKEYWNKFVLAWDGSVYDADAQKLSVLEKLATLFRGKLRVRHNFAIEFLKPHIHGRKVLELGCGTGRLSCDLLQGGATHVTGLDISETAIATAAKRAADLGISEDRYAFKSGEIEKLDCRDFEFDLVVGLGVLQYLRPESLPTIFASFGNAPLFFEFHENSATWLNFVHWIYRKCKSLVYRDYPFYRTISRRELRALLGQQAYYCQIGGVSFFTTCPGPAAGWQAL